MAKFLAQLHIGPVQGFIATARRTRDLWFGSYLLSEISKAAARGLHLSGGALIFPSGGTGPGPLEPDSPLLVANVILAEIDATDLAAARQVVATGLAAARTRWSGLCDEALGLIEQDRPSQLAVGFVRRDVWDVQRDDVLELFQAIVPVETDYAAANQAVRELMARRKNLRDFASIHGEPALLPKSSLDGARSTVIAEPAKGQERQFAEWRRRLGIAPGEQLDLPGLVKRVVGRRRKFVPVSRIAADEWIQRVGMTALAPAGASIDELVQHGLATRMDVAAYPWTEAFAWDGQLLFDDRLAVERERAKREHLVVAGIDRVAVALRGLLAESGAPGPYYALLLADGDHMGMLIDKAKTAEQHRRITRQLSVFAKGVKDQVNAYRCALIYSGGDDVLALVRVDQAVACADSLRQFFDQCLRGMATELGVKVPTLSAGIAVCHMLEPLGDALDLARKAEHLAKVGGDGTPVADQRNAVALIIKPRGGSAYRARVRWSDDAARERLAGWQARFFSGELPAGMPYELRDLHTKCASVFDPLGTSTIDGSQLRESQAFAELWQGRAATLLRKKRDPSTGSPLPKDLQTGLLDALTGGGAEQRIDELLVARWLAGKTWDDA